MPLFGSRGQTDVPESATIESGKKSEGKTRKTLSSGLSVPTNSTTNSDESEKIRLAASARSKSVLMGRGVFVSILVLVAVALGCAGYFFLHASEVRLYTRQWDSMMSRALEVTRSLATNKLQHGTMVMSQIAAYEWPNAESWPYVWVDGYWKIVENVLPTSIYTGIHLAPIVQPNQSAEFEQYAYGMFKETFGNDTSMGAYSHFGEGIWVQDGSIDTEDNRFHDTTGVSIHGSPYEILVPKLQHALGDSPYVMMNVHGFKRQGEAVDAVINCTQNERDANTTHNCQAVSEFNPPKMHSNAGPFGFICTPIFPANDPDTLVGFIFGAVFWDEVMQDMFPKDVKGVDCVFHTETEAYTYEIHEGSAHWKGTGDFHDPKYDEFKREKLLLDPATMAAGSARYITTCYPNDKFIDSYRTNDPIGVAIGAVLIIVFVSLLFFVYDRCVLKEFDAKKDLLEAKRQFVRFVSHEVRTPLNSVSMGLTLMKEEMAQSIGYKSADDMLENPDKKTKRASKDSKAEEKGKEWFDLAHEVHTSAQSSVDVLNDLLNYDKIENGSLSLELSVVQIWNLIDRTIGEFKLPMASKNINLHFSLPEIEKAAENLTPVAEGKVRDQKVIGDQVRITQVLRNLVSNAIKFTPEGGSIHVAAKWSKASTKQKERKYKLSNKSTIVHEPTGNLILTVKDTGAGMTREQLKQLFGQGIQFNVNELQHGNGSGLGLYIAMGIVQQHEGSLTCDSEGLGHGTTFTMEVPLFDIPTPEMKRPNAADTGDEAGDADYEDSKLNILIVDDAVSNRKLLRRLLKLKGHDTAEAENGQIAVNMVMEAENNNNYFDLVLMDYEMPVMTGPEAAKEIRKLGSDVFIVGVTGNLMAEDVSYFRECGSNAVLPKPFRINELEDIIIEHHITRHQLDELDGEAQGAKVVFADPDMV